MNVTIAYLVGMHLLNPDLHNQHPAIEFNKTLMIYQNSFEVPSVALYRTYQSGNWHFRAGLTSGYYNVQEYEGSSYSLPTATKEGVGLFLVPSYETGPLIFAVLGDSINVGLKWEFK
jgi:hypothetical protein